MVRSLLIRGMLSGLLAGVLGLCFAEVFGEPPVNAAIAFQSYVDYVVHHDEPEPELVSRSLQSTVGLGTGALLYGVALGGMLGIAFAGAYGRMGRLAARGTAALLGFLGMTAVYLVPFIKYPPNPPSIGEPDTIQYRTAVYVGLMIVSVVAMIAAVNLRQRLLDRFGEWNATLLAGTAYLAVVFLCYGLLPGINEVPQQAMPTVVAAVTDAGITFPPAVLWDFRIASLGMQVVIWGTIALVFGVLAERLLESTRLARTDRSLREISPVVVSHQ